MSLKISKLTIHKLKGVHDFGTGKIRDTCRVCGFKDKIGTPLFSKDKEWVILPDEYATMKEFHNVCVQNYTVYNKEIDRVYVTPEGYRKLQEEYSPNDMHILKRDNFSIFKIVNPTTGTIVSVLKITDADKLISSFAFK